jgi:cell division protein FtsW
MAVQLKTDRILFYTVLAIVMFGIVILYSASSVMAQSKHLSEWYFVGRQFAWMVLAVASMLFFKNTNYRRLQNTTVAFSAIGVMIILLVLVYFLDSGHHRWLRLGALGLQPSELAKPALVIFLAFFVTWRARAINNPRYTLLPAALALGVIIVIVAVADLGTAVVLGITATVIFFVAGLERRYCFSAAILATIAFIVFTFSAPYRVKRIWGFFDPKYTYLEKLPANNPIRRYLQSSLTTRDTSYQAEMSKVAFGSGGVLGKGLGESRQKLLYLPEAHTDFILAIVGEETGLIGTMAVLATFLVIFWRGLRATVLAPDEFGRYLALGVTTVIVVQALINMTSVLGLMPTKGIPLPMISAGGSSLLCTLTSLGILMNVSEHVG